VHSDNNEFINTNVDVNVNIKIKKNTKCRSPYLHFNINALVRRKRDTAALEKHNK